MRFHDLKVTNLRAIKRFEIEELGDFIVIAGQNGCGKSCLFDAIRLLKSVYGGYQANEYHQWFTEFQISLADPKSVQTLFRDSSKDIKISATISFSDSEKEYLLDNAARLVQPIAWQEVTGQPIDPWSFNRTALATQLRQFQEPLTLAMTRLAAELATALLSARHTLSLDIKPSGEIFTQECKPAEVAFQAYEPQSLGIIEYHSAARSYSRQQVGGINLDTRAFEDQQRQNRLYNWQAKYQNVKTELATSYLRTLIAEKSGDASASDDLNETMKELFQAFFPDKTYEGVRPEARGTLMFPVRLSTGETHDIDELSSGEKEILYGYLKLKNSTPRNSVILIDEPELHLNPSLLQGFPDFFYRHIGLDQGNQLWLVTHSDTLLRQAVGNSNYRVFQMVPATSIDGDSNQAVEVLADDDVERVTIELVGDLASYRPHGKVVILEGISENAFDVNLVRRLFPQFARRVNLVSGGNKRRVRDLYAALKSAVEQAGIPNRFFAIVDKDSDAQRGSVAGASEFQWDVYHIENYLLEPACILKAMDSLLFGTNPLSSDADVLQALRDCASELVDRLVLERLQAEVNGLFLSAIETGGPPDTKAPADDLKPSVDGAIARVASVGLTLTLDDLRARSQVHSDALAQSFTNDSWMRDIPGRDILRRFTGRYLAGKIDSIAFSSLVLDKMVEQGVKPQSMKAILDQILEESGTPTVS